MNILAIDTSKKTGMVSLKSRNKISFHGSDPKTKHSETLLNSIDNILSDNNTNIKDIDCYAVNIGPGSFTGLRIGVSVIKGFLFESKSKVVSYNSFDIIAYNIHKKRKNYFYVLTGSDGSGAYLAKYNSEKEMVDSSIVDMKDLAIALSEIKDKVYVSQNESNVFFEYLKFLSIVEVKEETIIKLAENKIKKQEYEKSNNIQPLYIKLSQAEIEFKKKLSNMLSIAEVDINNLDEISRLESEIFAEQAYTKNMINKELKLDDRVFLKAVYNGEILGYIGVKISKDNTAFIFKLAVKKIYRKLGVASRLINEIEKILYKKEIKDIYLEVSSNNLSGIRFYNRMNYKKIYTRKKYYKNGSDAIVMVKS